MNTLPEPVSETENLTDAQPDDVIDSISFALRFNGRKRVHHADDYMAAHVARMLLDHLTLSGYVIKKRPPRRAHSIAAAPRGEGV